MLRSLSLLLLPAVLFLVSPTPAQSYFHQSGPRLGSYRSDGLSGIYVNRSNGGQCSVERQGRGYLFVNENGSVARFVFAGRNQLEMTAGDWDPSVVVTVLRDRFGRTTLRFDSAHSAPGYWVPAS